MQNKKCINNVRHTPLLQQNKNSLCCNDDIRADIDLLHPILDNILQSLDQRHFDVTVFSKTMFIVTMIQSNNDQLDTSVKEIISNIVYFCYDIQRNSPSFECVSLGTSFIKEAMRWINYKLFQSPLYDKEKYIKSLRSDSETILSLMNQCVLTDSSKEEIDCLFF